MNSYRYRSLHSRAKRLPTRSLGHRLRKELGLLGTAPDNYLAELVHLRIADLEGQSLVCPFFEPEPLSGLDQGRIHAFNTANDLPVRIAFDHGKENRVTHATFGGQSNSGKSCLQALVLSGAARDCDTTVIDATRFFRTVPQMVRTHVFVRWEQLRIGCYDGPEHVPGHVIDQTVNREMCECYNLIFAEYELSQATRLLRNKGVPNFVNILDLLRTTQSRGFSKRPAYRESAMLVLQNLLDATGELFKVQRGMNLEELFSNNVVIEVDGLLAVHQAFLVRYLFSYFDLMAYRS